MAKALKPYGVVNVSVANLHARADLTSTIDTQALLGTGVTVLKTKGEWQYVRLPDNYCGWINRSLALLPRKEYKNWLAREKIIVTAMHAYTNKIEETNAPVVSDAVAGCCFALAGTGRKNFLVQYPDGRVAFLKKSCAQKLSSWKKKLTLTPESVIATARRFMGVPYMWGGTSAKALDCSGLVRMAFWLNGALLPRNSQQQARTGLTIHPTHARPGDLLFFGTNKSVTHVGIFLGNNKFIQASGDVHVSSLCNNDPDYDRLRAHTLLFVKRILGQGALL
jgi:gamma-D-glutamyl-L-lysine dipeptidyl-peptidase